MDISKITGNLSDARFVPSSGVALPITLTENHTVYNYPQHGNRVGFYLKELPYTMIKVERDDGVVYKEMEVDAVLGNLNFAVRKERHNLGFLWFGDKEVEGRQFTVSYQGLGMINHVENMLLRLQPTIITLVESPTNSIDWIAIIKVTHPEGVDVWISGQGGKGDNGTNGSNGGIGGVGAYGVSIQKLKMHLVKGYYTIIHKRIPDQYGEKGANNPSTGSGAGVGGAPGISTIILRHDNFSMINLGGRSAVMIIYGGGGGGGGGWRSDATPGKARSIDAYNPYFIALSGGGYDDAQAPHWAPFFVSHAVNGNYWIKIEARSMDIHQKNIVLEYAGIV